MSERRHDLWGMVIPESLDRLLSGMEAQVWRGNAGHYVGLLIGVEYTGEEWRAHEPDALTEPAGHHDRSTAIRLG